MDPVDGNITVDRKIQRTRRKKLCGKFYLLGGCDCFCGEVELERACRWFLAERLGYSLPTEAQWEYACRGGKLSAFSFGDDPSEFGIYGWSAENSFEIGEAYSHEVAKKRPCEFGLYDMHAMFGNGARITLARSSREDKSCHGNGGALRVNRGGGWNFATKCCRSASRLSDDAHSRYNNLGFRVALVRSSK